MRRLLLSGCLCALAMLSAAACIPPAPGSSATLPAQVLPADARALVYGRTVSEVIQSQELREKIPALFGADWMPASQGRGQVALGAAAFFEKGGPLRMVSIAGKDYIAVTGCVANACQRQRVLLLIAEGGSPLLARLTTAPSHTITPTAAEAWRRQPTHQPLWMPACSLYRALAMLTPSATMRSVASSFAILGGRSPHADALGSVPIANLPTVGCADSLDARVNDPSAGCSVRRADHFPFSGLVRDTVAELKFHRQDGGLSGFAFL